MGKLLKIVGVVVVLFVGGKVSQKIADNQLAASADAKVAETVAALNAQLPKQVAPGVSFTKAELIGKTLRNTYTLAPGVPLDSSSRSAYEANAVTQVCGGMSEMAKQGFTVEFRYEYTEGGSAKTFDISVPPSRCV